MIANATQLETALHQLASLQKMLEAMRSHLQETNPSLFPAMSESYLKRIEALQAEIIEYLRERPADSPLKVRLAGPAIQHGVVKATLISQLIRGLQSAIYQIGSIGHEALEGENESRLSKGLRSLLQLNLVATASGSFTLALDLAPRQLLLFKEYDVAAAAVQQLIKHVNELQQAPEAYTGDRPVLLGLSRIAAIVRKGVETIEIFYNDKDRQSETALTSLVRERIELLLGEPKENERTIVGTLIEINIENNKCKMHPENEAPVDCQYEEILEDDLIAVLKKKIEMAGQFIALDYPSGRYRITRIERFRRVDDDEDSD